MNRLSRLRQSKAILNMTGMGVPSANKFIWPIFLVNGKGVKTQIPNMPNQFRYSIDTLMIDLDQVLKRSNIGGVILFGVCDDPVNQKNGNADFSYSEENPVVKAIPLLKKAFPSLLICCDVCICSYSSHGHCGILDENGRVDHDVSNVVLSKSALSYAAAGADCVAPSAMVDGQVREIRTTLDSNKLFNTIIMSYSTKFASSFYSPFRTASDCAPSFGDRSTYQLPYNNANAAILESITDEKEGADILMVKPSLCYLDILSKIRAASSRPLAAYNVSGEYAMLCAAAQNGCGDLKKMARETILSVFRAGTDIFISYWANQYAEIFES